MYVKLTFTKLCVASSEAKLVWELTKVLYTKPFELSILLSTNDTTKFSSRVQVEKFSFCKRYKQNILIYSK